MNRVLLLAMALVLSALPALPRAVAEHEPPRCPMHQAHAGPHEAVSCQTTLLGALEVSSAAGIGQIELHGDMAAVVQRDEGLVALLDVSDPAGMRVLGRYDGNTGREELDHPLDGDVAFSHDGRFLFYARQTSDYSHEGLHAIDISDPAAPELADYAPAGGTLRVAYHRSGDEEYVVTADAILGIVVHRFIRTPAGGLLVPVHIDALPQLKVGGPASAGLFIDPRDPQLERPLLYVSTGRTGLQVFDFSSPHEPVLLGSWTTSGLADIEVVATGEGRTVYAATEYWFSASTAPRIVVLDASNLSSITQTRRFSPGDPAYPSGPSWRLQGLEVVGDYLYVAHSHAGLGILHTCCFEDPPRGSTTDLGEPNGGGLGSVAPYAMDVELSGETIFVSDASTGVLSALDFDPIWRHPEDEV